MKNTIGIVFGSVLVLGGCFLGVFLYTTSRPVPSEDVDTHSDIIFVTSPLPYTTVTSPLLVTGEARGDWFFETDFPVRLLNAQGEIIGQGTAEAQGNWMTSYFVPFEATITFTSDAQTKNTAGTLVLEKNNIYGRPENADELRVPVTIGE